MGIHGEPGRESRSLPADKAADKLADIMLESILGSGPGSPDARLETSPDDSVVLLVNNLGATPLLELLVVARRLISRLREKYQLRPVRVYVGPFMTALEMAGVSATILRLDTQGRMEAALDNPTLAPAWTAASQIDPNYDPSLQIISYSTTAHNAKARGGPACPLAPTVIRAVCERVASIESELTKYDSICGDGDCGLVMKAGVRAKIFKSQPNSGPL
jgi:dihydroxyacetone kinase